MITDIEELSRKPNYFWKNRYVIMGRETPTARKLGFDKDEPMGLVKLNCRRNGITTYLGGPSRGKTVTWKRDVDQALLINPDRGAIFIDGQGVDAVLMKQPALRGLYYPGHGEYRTGHTRIQGFTPAFMKNQAHDEDRIFTIPWTDLTMDEWEYLLTRGSDAKSWIYQFKGIIEYERKRIKSLPWLLREYDQKIKDKDYQSAVVPAYIGRLEVTTIARALDTIIKKKILTEPGDPSNARMADLVLAGHYPVVNLHLYRDVSTKLYSAIILRQVYEVYAKRRRVLEAELKARYHGDIPEDEIPLAPITVFEEFSALFEGENATDDSPLTIMVEQYLKRGMKEQFDFRAVLQGLMDIPTSIRNTLLNQRVFASNANYQDKELLVKQHDTWVKDVFDNMSPFADENGAYEWLLIDDRWPTTFRPAASLSQFHRR